MQERIDRFLEEIRKFITVENRLRWQSCSIYATAVNSMDNSVTYMLWITNRDIWQDVGKPMLDRQAVIKFIKVKQEELGLEFVKIKQAVQLVQDTESADLTERDTHNTGSVSVSPATPPA